jgi:hypothetical protein
MNDYLTLNFVREPKNEIYRDLLKFALQSCREGSLVVHPLRKLDESGQDFLREMKDNLIQVSNAKSWPGTVLHGSGPGVKLYRFKYNSSSAKILATTANTLFEWVQPHLPEDLCLIRIDGSPFLTTIAHERDAYLKLKEEERQFMDRSYPNISIILRLDV